MSSSNPFGTYPITFGTNEPRTGATQVQPATGWSTNWDPKAPWASPQQFDSAQWSTPETQSAPASTQATPRGSAPTLAPWGGYARLAPTAITATSATAIPLPPGQPGSTEQTAIPATESRPVASPVPMLDFTDVVPRQGLAGGASIRAGDIPPPSAHESSIAPEEDEDDYYGSSIDGDSAPSDSDPAQNPLNLGFIADGDGTVIGGGRPLSPIATPPAALHSPVSASSVRRHGAESPQTQTQQTDDTQVQHDNQPRGWFESNWQYMLLVGVVIGAVGFAGAYVFVPGFAAAVHLGLATGLNWLSSAASAANSLFIATGSYLLGLLGISAVVSPIGLSVLGGGALLSAVAIPGVVLAGGAYALRNAFFGNDDTSAPDGNAANAQGKTDTAPAVVETPRTPLGQRICCAQTTPEAPVRPDPVSRITELDSPGIALSSSQGDSTNLKSQTSDTNNRARFGIRQG